MDKEKKYCAAPWRSLHLNFEGQIKTCCAGNPNMLGNHDTGPIDDILQSETLKEIKESLRNGVLHEKYCENCIRRENITGESERQWHNNVSADFDVATAEIDGHQPALIDVRWNNTCNLACTYCSSYFSTKWASIVGKSFNQTINTQYQQVIDYIEKNQNTVKEVAMVGGEPLLMKENDRLLDILPDDVLITVITNMTADFEQFPVPQKLLKRSRVGWSMSFDNIGERFEYVRWGSSWARLDKNVSTVSNKIATASHHGGIHAVYNIYNCTKICELKDYALKHGLSITWQVVYGDQLDPSQHNQEIRQLAIDEINQYKDKYKHSYMSSDKRELNFLTSIEEQLIKGNTGEATTHDIKKPMSPDNITRSKEFIEFTQKIENEWHPDQKGQFEKLWPEIARAL